MAETLIRWPVCAAALAAALAMPACSRSAPAEAPPAPVAEESAPPPLAGAEAAVAAGAAGPQRYAEDYGRGYGEGYNHRVRDRRPVERDRALARERDEARQVWLQRHRVRHWRLQHHHLVFERGRPPHQEAVRHAAHPASAAAPAHQTALPAPRPTPHPAALVRPHRTRIQVRPEVRPVLQTQPNVTPLDHTMALPVIETRPAAPAVDLTAQLGQLTSAAAEDMKGAKLDVPSALSTGGEGKVVLTLPQDLLWTIQGRASSSSLGPAARHASVTAKLAGQGYVITPNGEQTARLGPDRPAIFTWDVKPSGAPGGVLTADMTASLQGEGAPLTFALGAVTAQIPVVAPAASGAVPATAAAPAPAAAPGADHIGFGALRLPDFSRFGLPDLSRFRLRDLAIPGHPTVAAPGLGQVASYKVVAAGLFALIVILLAAIMRSASARRERAEQRRRFHSFEAANFGDEHT
jgi:hypothetical protein